MKDKTRTISEKNKHVKTAKKKTSSPGKYLLSKKKKDEKKKPGLEGSVTFRKLASTPRYKKHAERYQNILENIQDGYFEVDFAGNFTFFNDSLGRILAVSDVVESMASHRPYRASLGLEAALEEIEKNKGIIYDENVADACLNLFREKGYTLT